MGSRYVLFGAVLAFAAFAAQAQPSSGSFRCVGKDGKKYYGSTVPQECMGMPMEQLNSQGRVVRHIDPAGDEAARAAKEAEALKKREQDNIAREESRRNRALLATYTSEKDIEEARGRALEENGKQMKQVEARIAEIKRRQAGFEKEMEFYQETPKGVDKGGKARPPEPKGKVAAKPPPKLVEDMQTAQMDLDAQQNLLDVKQKEVEAINAKYDDDKKRYLELTRPSKR
jgi:hypothetical protein